MPATPTRSSRCTPDGHEPVNNPLAGVAAGVRIEVPDGTDPLVALARTTDLAVVAHPDDLELSMVGPLLACRDDPERWFTGVVCTDGTGSVRPANMASLDDDAFAAVRAAEQVAAARAAGMSAVVLVGLPSDVVRRPGEGHRQLVATVAALSEACLPDVVHTHDPADPHATHVAVLAAVVSALRTLAPDRRPRQLVGWEGWRSVDWAPRGDRVATEVADGDAADALVRLHASQVATKRYDIASRGRRQAHATFADHLAADDVAGDEAAEVALGVDLTTLLDDTTDPLAAVATMVQAFADGVVGGLAPWWPAPAGDPDDEERGNNRGRQHRD